MFALDKHIVLRESDELARSDVLAPGRSVASAPVG